MRVQRLPAECVRHAACFAGPVARQGVLTGPRRRAGRPSARLPQSTVTADAPAGARAGGGRSRRPEKKEQKRLGKRAW